MEFPSAITELRKGEKGGNAELIIQNLRMQMINRFGAEQIPIPTAVVLTKLDELLKLEEAHYNWQSKAARNALLKILGLPLDGQTEYDNEPNDDNQDYFDRRHADEIHYGCEQILIELGGTQLGNAINSVFSNFRFFAVSALGVGAEPHNLEDEDKKKLSSEREKSLIAHKGRLEEQLKRANNDSKEKERIQRELDNTNDKLCEIDTAINKTQVAKAFHPLRVTEPFYWFLALGSNIPYHYKEVWTHKKNRERPRVIEFYYYENERGSRVNQRLMEYRQRRLEPRRNWIGPKTDDVL